ncbi:DUF4136 domain-containing protein [Pyxidicoccus parkwayensis]|uniref:DUF4136 domain-containing protein n=1 Tax=Pyxidicoccus parkwayensis TaxID=2813578 RepID=A0ABX7NZB5_9BACT|nr:DUF4136 domain-containing protein [Pyxidicoccus parkwaysis]QSQ22795.1 DUF4136 domain-containing protein [Pyxidicoccus parkwaysis]
MPTRRLVPLLAFVFTACAGIDVNTQYDGNAMKAASGYRTYAWLPHANPAGQAAQEGAGDTTVEKSVDAYLASRGYQRVEAGATPDLLIRWGSSINFQGILAPGLDPNPPRAPNQGPYQTPYPSMQAQPIKQEFSKGVLDIDIMDARAQKPVWRGTAQGELSSGASNAEIQEWLGKAVPKLLAEFPPEIPKD